MRTVEACPVCDSSDVNERLTHNLDDNEGIWKCYDCRETFDEPTKRDPYTDQPNRIKGP